MAGAWAVDTAQPGKCMEPGARAGSRIVMGSSSMGQGGWPLIAA